MRNAVPRFGMRAAVVLAVLAVVALAALLAVGSPASAQSSDVDEIFSATMTVGSSGIVKGYYDTPEITYGSLSNTEFTSPGTGLVNSIRIIIDSPVGGNRLHIGLVNQPEDPELEAMTLHIGGRTFKFVDATYDSTGDYHLYGWPITSRFGWADTDTVAVSITAVTIVFVEPPRSGTFVEFGEVAELIFNRTGSTDEALSFTFLHNHTGETATRTFEAGQSSFSNFHWAIDRDEDNNPVCIIQWQVQPGDGYVPGEGFTGVYGFVVVEGPGTTCMGGI